MCSNIRRRENSLRSWNRIRAARPWLALGNQRKPWSKLEERTEMRKLWSDANGPWQGRGVAIVGMAGRFPGAQNVAEFWQNLLDGKDSIARLTPEELRAEGVSEAALRQPNFVAAGGVLDDIELFDAAFFGISPREAESMDPQQ